MTLISDRLVITWKGLRGGSKVELSATISRDARADECSIRELAERHHVHRRTVRQFSGWIKTFTDPRLSAAMVDRLTFAEQIIETGTVSYRLAHARRTLTSRPASSPATVLAR